MCGCHWALPVSCLSLVFMITRLSVSRQAFLASANTQTTQTGLLPRQLGQRMSRRADNCEPVRDAVGSMLPDSDRVGPYPLAVSGQVQGNLWTYGLIRSISSPARNTPLPRDCKWKHADQHQRESNGPIRDTYAGTIFAWNLPLSFILSGSFFLAFD